MFPYNLSLLVKKMLAGKMDGIFVYYFCVYQKLKLTIKAGSNKCIKVSEFCKIKFGLEKIKS
jgi:hypothetical protein